MLHIGGLTFCPGAKQLQIPNLVAAERFGKAALDRFGLRLEDVSLAFKNIVSTGDIRQAFALYRQTMSARDVGHSDFEKKEEHHRDSFYYALLGNSHPSLRKVELEVKITKVRESGGISTYSRSPGDFKSIFKYPLLFTNRSLLLSITAITRWSWTD